MHRFAFALLLLCAHAFALPMPVHVKPGAVSNPLKTSGVANGGQAQDEFSLLSVQTQRTNDGERIVLNYGDSFGKPLKGTPGFFQVALDKSGKRIVIDLAQVNRSGIDPDQLKSALSKSKFVAESDMTMDPHELSTNLTLNLKEPVEVRIEAVEAARSRVILNLKALTK